MNFCLLEFHFKLVRLSDIDSRRLNDASGIVSCLTSLSIPEVLNDALGSSGKASLFAQ